MMPLQVAVEQKLAGVVQDDGRLHSPGFYDQHCIFLVADEWREMKKPGSMYTAVYENYPAGNEVSIA